MNCKELHAYYRIEPRAAIHLQTDSAEIFEHSASCSECARFIEEQKQLAQCLQIARESAPAVSPSLDRSVLANYRSYQSENSRSRGPASLGVRGHLREFLGLATVVAFAVVVACGAILLLLPPERSWMARQSTARQPTVVPEPATTVKKQMAWAQAPVRKQPKSVAVSAKRGEHPASVGRQASAVPTRFQSLMYCDPISCPDAMELIRVQLPSPILGATPASAGANGFIYADVLVGQDGIARGIRVVE